MNISEQLKQFSPTKEFFIGVDSDGTAFNTMEYKHKQIYIPQAVAQWKLQSIAVQFHEVAEYINLYSQMRGTNRFPALALTFSYLRQRADVPSQILPDDTPLQAFVASGLPMSNESLIAYLAHHDASILRETLDWSERSNRMVKERVKDISPFCGTFEALQCAAGLADVAVISATTNAALQQEWGGCGLLACTRIVAGQEAGPKAQQLAFTAGHKYLPQHALMIGDAPGDLEAARKNDMLFFPIFPRNEAASWEQFKQQVLPAFLKGKYAGEQEEALCREFLQVLSNEIPWETRKEEC